MGEIKNGRELWTELSKLYASAPNGKPKHAQLEGLMERATGKKIQNVTGFNLTDWKAAGEEARYRPGGSLPKSLNPVKDIQFLKSWFLGEGNGPQLKGDPWARREAWRYSGPFKTSILRWKGAFPGLGVATGAFALYLAYDIFLAKDDGGHH